MKTELVFKLAPTFALFNLLLKQWSWHWIWVWILADIAIHIYFKKKA